MEVFFITIHDKNIALLRDYFQKWSLKMGGVPLEVGGVIVRLIYIVHSTDVHVTAESVISLMQYVIHYIVYTFDWSSKFRVRFTLGTASALVQTNIRCGLSGLQEVIMGDKKHWQNHPM